MRRGKYRKEADGERFLEFINLLAGTNESEMSLSEIWEKTKDLYYYSIPDSIHPMINMYALKKDVKIARERGYLIMTGNRDTTKYVKTELLLKPPTKQ